MVCRPPASGCPGPGSHPTDIKPRALGICIATADSSVRHVGRQPAVFPVLRVRVSSGSCLLSGHTGDHPSQTPAFRWGHTEHGWNDRCHLWVEAALIPLVACHRALRVASVGICVGKQAAGQLSRSVTQSGVDVVGGQATCAKHGLEIDRLP